MLLRIQQNVDLRPRAREEVHFSILKLYNIPIVLILIVILIDSSPPRNWKPFLPHGIKDLRSDNWVKVIGPEGKIRGGRVRYVGYVLGQQEPFVGIELSTNIGNSDGSFNNRRYFERYAQYAINYKTLLYAHCSSSPNHALFLPFKKVIMGWRN